MLTVPLSEFAASENAFVIAIEVGLDRLVEVLGDRRDPTDCALPRDP